MLSKPERIVELEALIRNSKENILQYKSKARAYFEHGKQHMGKMQGYFQPMFDSNNGLLEKTLKSYPVSTYASWENAKLWDAFDFSTIRDESVIRIGDLFEPRTNGQFLFPAFIPFIGQGKTVILSGKSTSAALSLLQSLVIRTALMLPHQASYTLLDPAGAGIAFPMRRYLPQVQEGSGDVRRDLDQVTVSIQRIIETYLDAATISFELVPSEIRINERFNFVFAADFPNQYDRRAIEALQNIGNAGPVAGTYTFIHYNPEYELPRDMNMDGFKNAFYVNMGDNGTYTDLQLKAKYDTAPAPDLQSALFQKLRDAKPPERILDWDKIVGVSEDEWWQEESTKIIETPIGARGGTDTLNLWFGVNTNGQPCAHGMLGAMTGAGKSNLYHVLITGLAVRYSPEELRFYLIDGKDGVEFQPYKQLPHAEVVSLRSSPELSRSVLAELIEEKERRNSIFASTGVNDLESYREQGEPNGKLPRILLLVDEYQELFDGDKDGIASSYLLQLSQQGRSAGIHMLLASQRFGAAGMLNQTGIFGNLHLLMAMQMKSSDVQALTEFGRKGKALVATCDLPGKIVVNDKGGDDNANVPGKVAYLTSEERDVILNKLIQKAAHLSDDSLPRRVIFDGKSQSSFIDNPYVDSLVSQPAWLSHKDLEEFAREDVSSGGLGIIDWFASEHPRVGWLGQQFNVRGQAMIVLRRRVSENVLIVGGENATRYGMLASLLASMAINLEPKETELFVFDKSIAGSPWNDVLQTVYEKLLIPLGCSVKFSKETARLEHYLEMLIEELEKRRTLSESDLGETPSVFVVLTELDRVEAIRRKADSYGGYAESELGEKLRRLYLEGAPLGIHLILSFAGVRPMANVIDERRGLVNFRHRVALQMSEDESHTFTRSRKASQLQLDGPTPISALYVDIENDRSIKFKPYTSDTRVIVGETSLFEQFTTIGNKLAERSGAL